MNDEKIQDEKQSVQFNASSSIEQETQSDEVETSGTSQETTEREFSSRAEERIKELTDRIRVYEETLRALQQQQQPQKNETQEDDMFIDPAVKSLKNEVQMLKGALAYMYDVNDKILTTQKYSDYKKYEQEIEAQLANFRKQGQNLSREQVYLMVKAQKLLEKPQQVEEKKPKPQPPIETKSTKNIPQKPSLDDIKKQLESIKF